MRIEDYRRLQRLQRLAVWDRIIYAGLWLLSGVALGMVAVGTWLLL